MSKEVKILNKAEQYGLETFFQEVARAREQLQIMEDRLTETCTDLGLDVSKNYEIKPDGVVVEFTDEEIEERKKEFIPPAFDPTMKNVAAISPAVVAEITPGKAKGP